MATTQSRQLVYGNMRITFLCLVDEGEGDLEELQVTEEGHPLMEAAPEPTGYLREAPILVERFEIDMNVGKGEPDWREIEEHFDLGELFLNYQALQGEKAQTERENAALSRKLGIYETQVSVNPQPQVVAGTPE